LGLYNYYADTLSSLAKVLRFFMGIPGGDKKEGMRQLEIAAQRGTITRVGARFYLGRNLRTYDLAYARSIEILTPLVKEFPENPIFQLILADTHAKLNHREPAEAGFRAAAMLDVSDPACAQRIREVAAQALSALAADAPRRVEGLLLGNR
jgi:predicted Zn-dependent protease